MAASITNLYLRYSLANFGRNTTLQTPSVSHVIAASLSTSSVHQSRARPTGTRIKLKYTNSKSRQQMSNKEWVAHLNKVRKPRVEEENSFIIPKLEDSPDDMPIEMEDPFKPPRERCFLCKHNDIELSFKNVRLLSQFVSPYTGRSYSRHITGLCGMQQRRVSREIKRAQVMGLMPFMYKLPEYMKDPVLFGVSPARVGLLAEVQDQQEVPVEGQQSQEVEEEAGDKGQEVHNIGKDTELGEPPLVKTD